MRINILSIFFTLLTTYSCNEKTQYINYGDNINTSLVFYEKIDNNYDLNNISGEIIDVCPKKGIRIPSRTDVTSTSAHVDTHHSSGSGVGYTWRSSVSAPLSISVSSASS